MPSAAAVGAILDATNGADGGAHRVPWSVQGRAGFADDVILRVPGAVVARARGAP